MKKAYWVLLGSALALAGVGCKAEKAAASGGDTVAVVNGTPITQDEFYRYMMMKPTVRVATAQGVGSARVADTIGLQALDDMVRQKLLMQLAKDEGVFPSDADVNQELAFREKRNPNFVKQLTGQGLSLEMVRHALSIELAQERLMTKGVTVTKEEVDQHIKNNPKDFQTPATIDLLWIMATSEASRKQADEELKRGQMFQAVAERHSEARTARRTRWRFPIRAVDQLPAELRQIVMNTPELKATDWVKLRDGWAKFYVQKKSPAKPVPIDDTVRELVRRNLAMRRGRAANDLEERLMKMLRESEVDVSAMSLQEGWKRKMDDLKQTNTTPAGTTTGTTSGAAATAGTTAGAGGATNGR